MTEPTAPVFRALADANRRELLDRLFERDGQTLGELCEYLPEMTRFGVMQHLGVLEEADLVTTVKVGREKRHFLNPVPIRLVHDRWISKYAEPVVGAMSALKTSLETPMDTFDHIYTVYIKASPERVWRAITDGDETDPLLLRHARRVRLARRLAARLRLSRRLASPPTARSLEIEPGRRVDMTFHAALGPRDRSRGPGPDDLGRSSRRGRRLEAHRHEALIAGSRTAESFAGGVVYIVSGLKTLLETGEPMAVPVER